MAEVFSRPLKGTSVASVRFPAVETAGYYQTSRSRGTGVWFPHIFATRRIADLAIRTVCRCAGLNSRVGFSRPLKRTLRSFRSRFPAVETAGYYQTSRWRGTGAWTNRASSPKSGIGGPETAGLLPDVPLTRDWSVDESSSMARLAHEIGAGGLSPPGVEYSRLP